MDVREISSIAEFDALRSDWDAAFEADPLASPFMSWAWHRGWIDVTPDPWMTLAVRADDDSRYVGFLPISLRGSRSALRIDHLRELHAGGEPTADEFGFVCLPREQTSILRSLATHCAERLSWDRLRFEELNDARIAEWCSHLPGTFTITEHQGTPRPCMPLPASWDAYLETLSGSTRQSLRKRMRVVQKEFRTSIAHGSQISESMIDRLIHMASNRTWGQSNPHVWRLHSMLLRCAAADSARMVMVWKDETMVAAVAGLMDHKRKSWCLYVTAFDEQYSDFSPGRVAVALAIRDAIDLGMGTFDFLRGEEPYKLQFGAVSTHNRTLVIERPTFQAALRRGISGVRETLRM